MAQAVELLQVKSPKFKPQYTLPSTNTKKMKNTEK
jgi:hypothetical protein